MPTKFKLTKNPEEKLLSRHKIEADLEKLFPKRLWRKINWILVSFGQTHTGRKEKNIIAGNRKSLAAGNANRSRPRFNSLWGR